MCGRFTNTTPRPIVAAAFGVSRLVGQDWQPRYNVAPAQMIDAVVFAEGERRLGAMRWGFTPTATEKGRLAPINARGETVAELPLFGDSFRRRRCLVVADGFFEWQAREGGKLPHYIRLRSRAPFAIAGIWRLHRRAEADAVPVCSLITCAPNALMVPIHARMPVILPPNAYDQWLDPDSEVDALRGLLAPYAADEMEAYPVSRRVNSPRYDDRGCIEALPPG